MRLPWWRDGKAWAMVAIGIVALMAASALVNWVLPGPTP